MSIPALQKAAGILKESFPDADQSLALSRAVGIALGMATPLNGLGEPEFDTMTRVELISAVNNKKEVFHVISRCNEEALLCVDTAVRQFTKTFVFRMETARGNAAAFKFGGSIEEGTILAVELLVPVFRGLLAVN